MTNKEKVLRRFDGTPPDESLCMARILDEQYCNPNLGPKRKGTPFEDEYWAAAARNLPKGKR